MSHYCQRCGWQQPNWSTWAHAHPAATVFISAIAALFAVFLVAVIGVYPLCGWSIVAVSALGLAIHRSYQQRMTRRALASRAEWEYATRQ